MFSLACVQTTLGIKTVVEVEGALYSLDGTELAGSTSLDLLRHWKEAFPRLQRWAARREPELPMISEVVKWLPPVIRPAHVFCAAANYRNHALEMKGTPRSPSSPPFFFLKSPRSLIGDGCPIRIPSGCEHLDWECELAVILGRKGFRIAPEDALDYVAGYAVFNDITARGDLRRTEGPFVHDWLAAKSRETFGPLGPRLLPAAFVEDWRSLRLRLWVNGVKKQDGRAGDMIHGIPEQIAYLSNLVTLEPGDVIATGTPAGVGFPKGESLMPGDVVIAEIEGVGRMTNPCVAE